VKFVMVNPTETELESLAPYRGGLAFYRDTMIALGPICACSNITNHDIKYIDNDVLNLDNHSLLNLILSHEPDVVGFSGCNSQWPQAMNIAKSLHTMGIMTIYGGPNATYNPQKHVRYFDYVYRGMAEPYLQTILDKLSRDENIDDVPGICFLRDVGVVIKEPILTFDWAEYKRPDRSFVDMSLYPRAVKGLESPVDIVLSGQGCPFSCRFCGSAYLWKRRVNVLPVDTVISEIRYMMETYGTKTVHFREDNFNVNRSRLLEFCSKVKPLGVGWFCQSNVRSLDKDILQTMKESGMRSVAIGFESGSDSTLKFINKGYTVSDVRRVCKEVLDVGDIILVGAFMIGTPNETRDDILRTFDLAEEFSRISGIEKGGTRFCGWPVSELYYQIQKDDLVVFDWNEGECLIPRTYHLSNDEIVYLIDNYGS